MGVRENKEEELEELELEESEVPSESFTSIIVGPEEAMMEDRTARLERSDHVARSAEQSVVSSTTGKVGVIPVTSDFISGGGII